jgi:succinate dehydrogenase / fumarate reductase cytochrome b subunit
MCGINFNEMSHFMGIILGYTLLCKPVLVAGVVFHFIMGIGLDPQKQKKARPKLCEI